MLDLDGPELGQEDKELLQAPQVGGVILFSRNYHDPEQLTQLIDSIHAVRQPKLLIAVDHEGGRVQRFREGFTRLPPAAAFGEVHNRDPGRACRLASMSGWLTASELRASGLDFSFSPVLDLRSRASDVIGDRAFHADVDAVVNLGRAYISGLKRGGMAAVGKHFPGHGSVKGDSHLATPCDHRDLETVQMSDLRVFERIIADGLPAIMPAHVIFDRMDNKPAGFSRYWLKEVLRGHLKFQGAVFSDDLVMAGAAVAGDIVDRGAAALEAGCDMLLACNDREAAVRLLDAAPESADPIRSARLARMHGLHQTCRQILNKSEAYRTVVAEINALNPEPELDLGFDAPA
jgi:beta-N-acetylhexosaminidase